MQTKYLFVLILIRNKGEVGTTGFSPPVKNVLKLPKRSGRETYCFCSVSSSYYYSFSFSQNIVQMGSQ